MTEKGRYGIGTTDNTGEGKTFIKGGSPQMIDRHPERLIRGHDADIGGGPTPPNAGPGTSPTADVSAEQERWMICSVCYFAIPAEGHQGGTVPHTEPWTRGECPNRGLVEVVPAADNRALVALREIHNLLDEGRANYPENGEAARARARSALAALQTVSGQGEKPSD